VKEDRHKKKKKPEGYIDLFADDDEEETPSVGSLFSDDEDEEGEDLFPEDETSEADTDEPAEEADAADGSEGEPTQKDWTMPLPTDEEANYVAPDDAPLPQEAGSASRETFTFDRYGRRTGKVPRKKRQKERYGKRKHAKKASTTLLLNETEVRKEREEARKRASERDELRQKQRRMDAEQRKARRKVEMKKRLSVLLVLMGLGVLLILAGYFTFLIRSIDIVGNMTRYSKEELVAASGLKMHTHILFQDLDKAQEKLCQDPYLNATVKYMFPNRIRITIMERSRAGAVAWGPNKEYIAVIDREGIVLESDAANYTGLPLVQGLIITGANPGSRIGDPADEQVQSMLDVLSTLEELGLADRITTVDLTEIMGISLYMDLTDSTDIAKGVYSCRVEVGDTSDLFTKLNRLKKNKTVIQEKAKSFLNQAGVDNVTVYLYSKNGVVISPHEVGYVVPSSSPSSTNTPVSVPAQNNPDEPAITPAPNVPTDPDATPGPDTPPPFNQGGFTG
jgi:hypothetical protein